MRTNRENSWIRGNSIGQEDEELLLDLFFFFFLSSICERFDEVAERAHNLSAGVKWRCDGSVHVTM